MPISIGDALKDEATRKIVSSHPFRLDDWQLHVGYEAKEIGAPDFCIVEVNAHQVERIDITIKGEDGMVQALLWLELQDGKFKVHAYDTVHEAPLTLAFTGEDIIVDDQRP